MSRTCRPKKSRGAWIAPRQRCVLTSPMPGPNSGGTSREGSSSVMNHPTKATLALHAGGDLGPIARWRTERHIARCERCRDEFAAFAEMRGIAPDLGEIPEVPWTRLAAEMKANIRLGLAAGECVRAEEKPLRHSLFSGARALVAVASVVALVV